MATDISYNPKGCLISSDLLWKSRLSYQFSEGLGVLKLAEFWHSWTQSFHCRGENHPGNSAAYQSWWPSCCTYRSGRRLGVKSNESETYLNVCESIFSKHRRMSQRSQANTIDDRRVVRKHQQKRCSCDFLASKTLAAPQHCWTNSTLKPSTKPSFQKRRVSARGRKRFGSVDSESRPLASKSWFPLWKLVGFRDGFGWGDTWLFNGSEPVEVVDRLYHGLDSMKNTMVLYIPDFCRVSSINSRIPIGVALIEKASLIFTFALTKTSNLSAERGSKIYFSSPLLRYVRSITPRR